MPAGRPLISAFWVLPVAYAAAFAAVRAYAVAFQPEMLGNPEGTYFGRVVAVNGFHVHHGYYGFALLPLAAWLLVRRRPAVGLALAGVALALIADEVMLFATGFEHYNHPWREPIALAMGAALLLAAALASRLAGGGVDVSPPTGPRAP